jgi:hypothetical protein
MIIPTRQWYEGEEGDVIWPWSGVVRYTGVGESSYTLKDNRTGSPTGTSTPGVTQTDLHFAYKFTASSSYAVSKIELPLYKNNSPTFTVDAAIFSHDSGEDDPSSLVGSWSGTVNAADLPAAGGTYVAFTGTSADLISGTVYWIVIRCSGYDASNYIHWERDSVAGRICRDQDGSGTWNVSTTSRSAFYKLYSSP